KTGLHCIDALSAAAGTGHSGNAHQMSPPRVPGTDVDFNPWAPRDLTRFHVAVLDEQPITREVLSICGQGYPHCDCQITRAATKLVCLETSGTFCESTVQGPCTPPAHDLNPIDWVKRANKDRCRCFLALGHEVDETVNAVIEIDVRM